MAHNPLPGVPPVESPFFARWLDAADLSDEEARIARDLNENGYAVIDFPMDDFGEVADRLKSDLMETPQFSKVKAMSPENPVECFNRIQNHTEHPLVRAIASDEAIIELLSKLYGRRAFPFQTLSFAMGTQQHYHSDSVHFSSIPERFMVGVWVALEDIGPDQGPLVYYPGSHKWPILQYDEIGISLSDQSRAKRQDAYHDAWQAYIDANGVEPAYFHPKKGQALIWAANLLHGGAPHTDHTRTRWSQVTHYYFEDCTYCIPMRSNARMNRMYIREGVTDISTGRVVENRYLGRPASAELPSDPTVAGAIRHSVDRFLRRRKVNKYTKKLASQRPHARSAT